MRTRPRPFPYWIIGPATATLAAALTAAAAPAPFAGDLTATPALRTPQFRVLSPASTQQWPTGDGFAIFRRGVGTVPAGLLDDSVIAPPDQVGIIRATDTLPFLGIVDTINPSNTLSQGGVSAEWRFSVLGFRSLELSLAAAAMGDFEYPGEDISIPLVPGQDGDWFRVVWSIDSAPEQVAWQSQVRRGERRVYTLESGATADLGDPMDVGAARLNNTFQPLRTPIAGTGSVLMVRLEAAVNGDIDAVAFRELLVLGEPAGVPCPGDLDDDCDTDIFDIFAYFGLFAGGGGDRDADGDTDIFDIFAFFAQFAAGCDAGCIPGGG